MAVHGSPSRPLLTSSVSLITLAFVTLTALPFPFSATLSSSFAFPLPFTAADFDSSSSCFRLIDTGGAGSVIADKIELTADLSELVVPVAAVLALEEVVDKGAGESAALPESSVEVG